MLTIEEKTKTLYLININNPNEKDINNYKIFMDELLSGSLIINIINLF